MGNNLWHKNLLKNEMISVIYIFVVPSKKYSVIKKCAPKNFTTATGSGPFPDGCKFINMVLVSFYYPEFLLPEESIFGSLCKCPINYRVENSREPTK